MRFIDFVSHIAIWSSTLRVIITRKSVHLLVWTITKYVRIHLERNNQCMLPLFNCLEYVPHESQLYIYMNLYVYTLS